MTIAFDLKIHFLKTTEEQTLFCTYPTYGIDPIINLSSNMYLMNEKKRKNFIVLSTKGHHSETSDQNSREKM